MASSAGRDDDNRNEQSESKNPFIRFKQFADQQVSALLQGIIGLPSAISKLPPVNARWTEFDNEVKRRNENKGKQNELETSEIGRASDSTGDGTVSIPVKKSTGWDTSTTNSSKQRGQQNAEDGITMDLPLYSPVSKALFARLDPSDKALDWEEGHEDRRLGFGSGFFLDTIPFSVPHDARGSSIMKIVQSIAYYDLKSQTRLRSESSLLPYLLFSPYSPIKLSLESQAGYNRSNPSQPQDDFPYQEAFEDLILTAQGHPMERPAWPSVFRRDPFMDFPLLGGGVMRAGSAIAWIHKLNAYRLLEPLETGHERGTLELSTRSTNGQSEDPETEEDMYDSFNRALEDGSTILSRFRTDIERQFRDLENASKELQRLVETDTTPEDDLDDFEEDKSFLETEIERLENQLSEAKRKYDKLASNTVPQPKQSADPDQVVSTSTSYSTRIHEDGTVETKVQIRRRFADGRETVTTKTSVGDKDFEETTTSDAKTDTSSDRKEDGKKGKDKKNGWFWS